MAHAKEKMDKAPAKPTVKETELASDGKTREKALEWPLCAIRFRNGSTRRRKGPEDRSAPRLR